MTTLEGKKDVDLSGRWENKVNALAQLCKKGKMEMLHQSEQKMVDIHMHLIPGVDDGAEDMMMARMMLLRTREQGVCAIFCTPHSEAYDYAEDVNLVFQKLKANVERAYPDMKLYLGCEVYCEERMMPQVLEKLNTGHYPTMNGTKYVLTEFSVWDTPQGAISCVKALAEAGYKPIIAHMERYPFLWGNWGAVKQIRELGALVQVNAYSLFDEEDASVRDWARQLVGAQMVDFLGTDAHRTYHRPPNAEYGLRWLYQNADQAYADTIAWKNAQEYLL